MVCIPKEKLRGYRAPTEFELNKILHYLTIKTKRERRPMNFWSAVCSVIAGSGIISILHQPLQRQLGTLLVMVLMTAVSIIGVVLIRRSKSDKRNLLKQTEMRNCKVMDCKAYHVSFSMRLNSKAVVKVYNDSGQYCSDDFLIDIESAQKYQSDPETPFLLFNCNDYYELISDKRMEVEK